MKLYFNSLNNTKFESIDDVIKVIAKDLTKRVGTEVSVELVPIAFYHAQDVVLSSGLGESIDEIDTEITHYTVTPDFLVTASEQVEEVLCSDLLKSNCLVTHQPDWSSVRIAYKGLCCITQI